MSSLYFNEPQLRLTTLGEFFVRLTAYSSYALLSIGALFLLFSDAKTLRGIALIVGLFLVDRLLHAGGGERTINELSGDKKNIALTLTPAAYRLISYAYRKSRMVGHDFHLLLLYSLLERSDIKESLKRLGIASTDFEKRIERILAESPRAQNKKEELLSVIESLTIIAYESAVNTSEKFVEPRNLFVALSLVGDPQVAKIFELFNLSTESLQEAVIFGKWRKFFFGIRRFPAVLGGFARGAHTGKKRVMNRAWTARPTPLLDSFSTDLTDLAREERIGLLIGHRREFDVLLQAVARPGKPNALLVGEPGSGKSTMIAHLAFRMVNDDVPPTLFDKRLVSLEINTLIADIAPEELAGRLNRIVNEVLVAGNIVLFIPNVHDLFRTGQAKAINAIDLILPVIKNAGIPVIGETYPREFKQFIEPRTDFLEQFQTVLIEEISEEEALRFLIYTALLLEKEFKVFITFRAIERAVSLAHKYFREKMLPGSAVDLLKQALEAARQGKRKILSEDDVVAVAERQSKIPIQEAQEVEAEKLLNLEGFIHEKLVNQEAAVSAVSRALREYRSGMSRKGGPIATFLFVGPTGVGKTELAKILTKIQFGSQDLMLRFDMSEYQDKQNIYSLIGTPDGSKSGALTEAVLKAPYSLVLLDEFEKAHSDILNLFLQVFDDGRLTDNLGRVVNFQNTIIIATSNAHSELIKTEVEKGVAMEDVAAELKKKLTDYFKPELINRFSDIIVFRNLKPEETYLVAKILTKDIINLLRETHGVELVIDDSALKQIAVLGYSPVFGARPLRQVISEKLRSVLAEKILRREIARGDTLTVSFEGNVFVWKGV
ncbi:MAG: ATP-dependent Clp protease ATP-binding subunit [Candidatus Paceibacterota bacterium]|jgi:ATP-dependent Clp protease ATP-binding subunit ClpC